jgi:hypothetical protein
MDSSETRQKVISLGRQLVAQLSVHDHTDTLSRWVAHYVAEQIAAIEISTGQEKVAAEKQCFEAILALWAHRNKLPDGLRPFEGFEPVLRALARLDPEEPRSMYYQFQRSPDIKGEPSELSQLVEFVISLDRVARILIEFALNLATTKAMQPETKTILENAFPPPLAADLHSIKELLRRQEALDAGEDLKTDTLGRKRERFEELEKFCSLCKSVKDELKAEINALEAP